MDRLGQEVAESLDPFSKDVEGFLDHYQQFWRDKMTRRL
jgi:hypothetical protein